MANVQFQCGKCKRMLAVSADFAGKDARCPHCGEVSRVPDSAPPPKTLSSVKVMRGPSTLLWTIVIFLVPYSLLATAAAIYFYSRSQSTPHPLEMLPDWPRDQADPVKRKGSVTLIKVDPNAPLPPWLRTHLGGTLRVGDLEITPEKIERREIAFRYENSKVRDPSEHQALVLTVKLKNVGDYAFAPDDFAYRRAWRENDAKGDMPYSRLEVGTERYYGGACRWTPPRPSGPGRREADPVHYVDGQAGRQFLEPGEEVTTIVCTDPEDNRVLAALGRSEGPFLWRVQFRRGLVSDGTRETTASAVIGVDFTPQDISR